MKLLGVDVGTTHSKAGLFDEHGDLIRVAACPTPIERVPGGATHDPGVLWDAVVRIVRDAAGGDRPDVVGVASMAEAGLLIDRSSGEPRTPILAWFDTRSTRQSEEVASLEDPLHQFRRSGLHPSFKYGVSKLIWLRDEDKCSLDSAVWLSVSDYIVYRLTGKCVTDPTLAARTYAYDIFSHRWDDAWIRRLGLEPSLFPRVLPSGAPAGEVGVEVAHATSLPQGTPVAVSGHDHLCAGLAAGLLEPGPILDSIGTAESIMAVTEQPVLDEAAPESGLALVPHVIPGCYCWLGGLSSAGGSIEWLRQVVGDVPPSYDQIAAAVAALPPGPTSVLYFPYLVGSGAPMPDRHARGAFFGLAESDGQANLFKSVLQGTAFEATSIQEAVARAAGASSDETIVVGGGAHNPAWLRVRADVSRRVHHVPDLPEATCLGAAFTAALGHATLSSVVDVRGSAAKHCAAGLTVEPDGRWVDAYRLLYEQCYVPLRRSVHRYAELLEASGLDGSRGG